MNDIFSTTIFFGLLLLHYGRLVQFSDKDTHKLYWTFPLLFLIINFKACLCIYLKDVLASLEDKTEQDAWLIHFVEGSSADPELRKLPSFLENIKVCASFDGGDLIIALFIRDDQAY